jgi:hypothetical protein
MIMDDRDRDGTGTFGGGELGNYHEAMMTNDDDDDGIWIPPRVRIEWNF